MLVKKWSTDNSYALCVGGYNHLENASAVSYKLNHTCPKGPAIPYLGIYTKNRKIGTEENREVLFNEHSFFLI